MEPVAKIGKREIISLTSFAGGPDNSSVFELGIATRPLPGDTNKIKIIGKLEFGKQVTVMIFDYDEVPTPSTVFGFRIRR